LGRLTAVSFRPYRNHQLELHDSGGTNCRVIVHPPRGEPQEITIEGTQATLAEKITRAKALIDAVMGPKPPPRARPPRPMREPW
jgi:hypothetical protein